MFMKEIKECHEFLDTADPFSLEVFNTKTDEQLLEIQERELKMKNIYISRNKSTTELDKRIKTLETLIRLRYLNKALADFEQREKEGLTEVEGYSLV
jgi:hypothetical protein